MFKKITTQWKVTKNTKTKRDSNILYELPDYDSLRIETCSNASYHLLNWVIFDRSAGTVVLLILLLAVTQRNLRRRYKSRPFPCHSTDIMGVWEVWSCISRKVRGFKRSLPTKIMLPLQRWDIKFKSPTNRNLCQ